MKRPSMFSIVVAATAVMMLSGFISLAAGLNGTAATFFVTAAGELIFAALVAGCRALRSKTRLSPLSVGS
jgi:hypothetical protein